MASKSTIYSLNKNKYLLTPEVENLERLLKSHLNSHPRDTGLLFLALYTGGRAKELLNIESKDMDSYEGTVLLKGLKGSNDREIPLPKWLFSHIHKLNTISTRPFPISYSRLHQIWDIYRPVAKKFHSLRHTFAIRLYKKTRDLRLVQVALGHRNITNTMIYADYIYSQQELKRLIL